MKYVLTLDVAKGKSMIMLASSCGEVLIDPFEIKHNESDFKSIDSKINSLNIKDSLTIIMEATSIYHKAPERFFKSNSLSFDKSTPFTKYLTRFSKPSVKT